MAELRQKRCGEELDKIRDTLESLIEDSAIKQEYHHECALHPTPDSEACEELRDWEEHVNTDLKTLEEAFDDLAKCLGRIAK